MPYLNEHKIAEINRQMTEHFQTQRVDQGVDWRWSHTGPEPAFGLGFDLSGTSAKTIMLACQYVAQVMHGSFKCWKHETDKETGLPMWFLSKQVKTNYEPIKYFGRNDMHDADRLFLFIQSGFVHALGTLPRPPTTSGGTYFVGGINLSTKRDELGYDELLVRFIWVPIGK